MLLGEHVVSAGTNGGGQARPPAPVTGRRDGPDEGAVRAARHPPQTWGLRCQQPAGGELGALPAAGRGRAGPAAPASGMLQNPVASTPFSVDDILRLEREQVGLAALQLREARRSPGRSQDLRPVPDPRGAEVPKPGGRGDGDGWPDGSEAPRDPSERVTEMDVERVGEYILGAGHRWEVRRVQMGHGPLARERTRAPSRPPP